MTHDSWPITHKGFLPPSRTVRIRWWCQVHSWLYYRSNRKVKQLEWLVGAQVDFHRVQPSLLLSGDCSRYEVFGLILWRSGFNTLANFSKMRAIPNLYLRIAECCMKSINWFTSNTTNSHHTIMDYEKAKRALDALSQERQAQYDRLQLAAQAKRELENRYSKIEQ